MHTTRRTFAIISHPDAGKTTLTEQLLLYGGAVQLAGTVKGRKAARHATSDWLALEKERGISVTTAVMQFPYEDCLFNLLDTPGHADFSEDTYRTLSAVDAALMVIDVAKGVEERTLKLLQVCRRRHIPIITFINKCDRHGRDPLDLLDEIEQQLDLQPKAQVWPIGFGQDFKGLYEPQREALLRYQPGELSCKQTSTWLPKEDALKRFPTDMQEALENWELARELGDSIPDRAIAQGLATPVYFGSALKSFGIPLLMDALKQWVPHPHQASTLSRDVLASEPQFSGFVFKIQANMDPKHRDRMAFLRVCSGKYEAGMNLYQVRTQKKLTSVQAQTLMAGSRKQAEQAVAGDIIGIYNHGGIRIGDTFTTGEPIQFIGVPCFAPELFRRVQLKDPLKQKSLLKGLMELAEEGATQFFRTHLGQQFIVGAIGTLQFDVVAYRLQHEYQVQATFETCSIQVVRWLDGPTEAIRGFMERYPQHTATDSHDMPVYLAPSRVHLQLTQDRHPELHFLNTYEPTDSNTR